MDITQNGQEDQSERNACNVQNDLENHGSQDYVQDWLSDLKAEGLSPATLQVYGIAVRQFLNQMINDLENNCSENHGSQDHPNHMTNDLDRRSVRTWRTSLQAKAPATQGLYLLALRSYVRWLVREGLLQEDVTAGLRTPKPKPVAVVPLTSRELTRLLGACDKHPRDRAVVALLISSGMRAGEAAGVLLTDLDLGECEVKVLGKGSRWRVAPMDERAASLIRRYVRGERRESVHASLPNVFLSERGALSASAVNKLVASAGERAGIEHVFPHRLRHTFASRWLDAGGSESSLMKLMGWTSSDMLRRYSAHGAQDRALSEYRRLRCPKIHQS